MVTKVKTKRKRVSRSALVNQYMSRMLSGKSTKAVERKMAKTKVGRKLKAKYSRR
jgi:hypothetical protein